MDHIERYTIMEYGREREIISFHFLEDNGRFGFDKEMKFLVFFHKRLFFSRVR